MLNFIKIISIPLGMLYYLFCQFRFFIIAFLPKKIIKNQYVIGVGNLSSGGTGKTPIEIKIASLFHGKVNIITRGYKRKLKEDILGYGNQIISRYSASEIGDEAFFMAARFNNAFFVISTNKEKSFSTYELPHCVTIMDDSFHKYKIYQNLRICVIDAFDLKNFSLPPFGRYRHPLTDIFLADILWLNKKNFVSEQYLKKIIHLIQPYMNKKAKIISSSYLPEGLMSDKNFSIPLDSIKGKKLLAFCGIGSPDSFFQLLEKFHPSILDQFIFDDHHQYSEPDIEYIVSQNKKYDYIITTEKDWVKLNCSIKNLYYLKMEIVID